MSRSNLFTETVELRCPYCGERIEVVVDPAVDSQRCIEDCQVCCRPIELAVRVDGDRIEIDARREDEG